MTLAAGFINVFFFHRSSSYSLKMHRENMHRGKGGFLPSPPETAVLLYPPGVPTDRRPCQLCFQPTSVNVMLRPFATASTASPMSTSSAASSSSASSVTSAPAAAFSSATMLECIVCKIPVHALCAFPNATQTCSFICGACRDQDNTSQGVCVYVCMCLVRACACACHYECVYICVCLAYAGRLPLLIEFTKWVADTLARV